MLQFILSSLFLALIFIRPFICSVAYPVKEVIFSWALIITCVFLLKSNLGSSKYPRNPIFFFIVLFTIAIAISTLFSLAPQNSLMHIHKYLCVFLVFGVCSTAKNTFQKILLLALILSASFVSLQAIMWVLRGSGSLLQFLNKQNISYDFAFELISRKRAFAPFILPAVLGGYLIMALPLSISYFISNYKDVDVPLFKRPPINSLLSIPIVLIFIALVLTKAIGPIISLALAFIVFSLWKRSKQKKFLLCSVLILGVIIILILITRSYNVGYWRNPIYSLGQRQIYWYNTLQIIAKHPVLGTGLGNLPFVGSKFSHNSYLQIWAEAGIFGLVALCGIILCTLKTCFSKQHTSDALFSGLCIANLAFIFHNIIDFTFFLPEVSFLWWIIIGLLHNYHNNNITAEA